uniref:Uncharacterized protein n=1 Tax=Glycine max TaxID=3847 RepID=C6T6A7_SOYBN|nr:unknown [Glycine max]
MNMVSIVYVFVINYSGCHTAESVTALHVLQKSGLKLFGIALNYPVWVLSKNLHLTLVPFTHAMTFKPILISALLLTHLAIPTKLLQSFCFDSVGNCFRCEKLIFSHHESEIGGNYSGGGVRGGSRW